MKGRFIYRPFSLIRRLLPILLCLFALSAQAQKKFRFSATCLQAQQAIFLLHIDEAEKLIAEAKRQDKDNVVPFFLEGYTDFFRSFISEEQDIFKKQENAYKKRMSLLKQAEQGNAYYLFTQAEAQLQRAIVRLKFGQYLDAAVELNDAYKQLKKNTQLYPQFMPNNKSMGLLEVMIGTVPSKYQWATKAIGLQGNIDQGIKRLEDFVKAQGLKPEEEVIKSEALFMLGFLQLYVVKKPEQAWNIIEPKTRNYKNNLLYAYVRAVVAKGTHRNDEAIKVLEARPRGPEVLPFYYLDYLLGVCKQQRLDNDAAIWFKTYTTFFKGRNLIKESYLRLGWCSLLAGNTDEYYTYLSLVEKNGAQDMDEDKQAQATAVQRKQPDIHLLRARLLFDGGYYTKAYAQLENLKASQLSWEKEKVELLYRKGRICQESGKTGEAIDLFHEVIAQAANMPYYFAANSALQLGYIYEQAKQYSLARTYFKKATSFKHNREYQSSIENKAKAGLKRIENK